MQLTDERISNQTGQQLDSTWIDELKACYATTCGVLNELRAIGCEWKDVREVVCESREFPVWFGHDESSGTVRIDPSRHEALALAHEMGHGFHECWRQKPEHHCCGESMAEAIRFFVEERMGASRWTPSADRLQVLDACQRDFDVFKKELSGRIARLGGK